MKRMKYQARGTVYHYDETAGVTVQKESTYELDEVWSEEAYASAEAVALGEVKIYDDGEDTDVPAIEKRVAALEDSSAEMTQALDMILSGVTE